MFSKLTRILIGVLFSIPVFAVITAHAAYDFAYSPECPGGRNEGYSSSKYVNEGETLPITMKFTNGNPSTVITTLDPANYGVGTLWYKCEISPEGNLTIVVTGYNQGTTAWLERYNKDGGYARTVVFHNADVKFSGYNSDITILGDGSAYLRRDDYIFTKLGADGSFSVLNPNYEGIAAVSNDGRMLLINNYSNMRIKDMLTGNFIGTIQWSGYESYRDKFTFNDSYDIFLVSTPYSPSDYTFAKFPYTGGYPDSSKQQMSVQVGPYGLSSASFLIDENSAVFFRKTDTWGASEAYYKTLPNGVETRIGNTTYANAYVGITPFRKSSYSVGGNYLFTYDYNNGANSTTLMIKPGAWSYLTKAVGTYFTSDGSFYNPLYGATMYSAPAPIAPTQIPSFEFPIEPNNQFQSLWSRRSVDETLPAFTGTGASGFIYSVDGLPSWLTFEASTRRIFGTVPYGSATTQQFTYTATYLGESTSVSISISLESREPQPVGTGAVEITCYYDFECSFDISRLFNDKYGRNFLYLYNGFSVNSGPSIGWWDGWSNDGGIHILTDGYLGYANSGAIFRFETGRIAGEDVSPDRVLDFQFKTQWYDVNYIVHPYGVRVHMVDLRGASYTPPVIRGIKTDTFIGSVLGETMEEGVAHEKTYLVFDGAGAAYFNTGGQAYGTTDGLIDGNGKKYILRTNDISEMKSHVYVFDKGGLHPSKTFTTDSLVYYINRVYSNGNILFSDISGNPSMYTSDGVRISLGTRLPGEQINQDGSVSAYCSGHRLYYKNMSSITDTGKSCATGDWSSDYDYHVNDSGDVFVYQDYQKNLIWYGKDAGFATSYVHEPASTMIIFGKQNMVFLLGVGGTAKMINLQTSISTNIGLQYFPPRIGIRYVEGNTLLDGGKYAWGPILGETRLLDVGTGLTGILPYSLPVAATYGTNFDRNVCDFNGPSQQAPTYSDSTVIEGTKIYSKYLSRSVSASETTKDITAGLSDYLSPEVVKVEVRKISSFENYIDSFTEKNQSRMFRIGDYMLKFYE